MCFVLIKVFIFLYDVFIRKRFYKIGVIIVLINLNYGYDNCVVWYFCLKFFEMICEVIINLNNLIFGR